MKTIMPEEIFVSQRVGVIEKYVDENNVRWYDFEKLVNSLKIKYGYANELYGEIEDCNKDKFEVLSKYGRSEKKRFITSEAICKLLNSARESLIVVNDFLNAIIKDEKHESVDYDVYEQQVVILSNAINLHDDENICKAARQIMKTDVCKNTLDKLDPTFDKEKEELIEAIRCDIYNAESEILAVDLIMEIDIDNEESNETMYKRPDADNHELREILYQRHKGQESSCPSWLKEIIR